VSLSRPRRILCVDDSTTALQVRTLVLQHNGYEVLAASNGVEAMTIFRQDRVDLVVLDHFLEDGLGTTLATEMKRLKPQIPVVILSGAMELPDGFDVADVFISKLEPTVVVLETIDRLLKTTDKRDDD
jgi:CheY-like chemotaxis protein